MTLQPLHQPTPIVIPRCVGGNRHERLVRKYVAPVKLMSPGRSDGTRNSQPTACSALLA